MSDPMNDRPTMSREPDGTDDLLPREWFKHMRAMTPEERERRASLDFPQANIGDTCCGKCPGDTCYVDQVTGA